MGRELIGAALLMIALVGEIACIVWAIRKREFSGRDMGIALGLAAVFIITGLIGSGLIRAFGE